MLLAFGLKERNQGWGREGGGGKGKWGNNSLERGLMLIADREIFLLALHPPKAKNMNARPFLSLFKMAYK